jgi:hypothetical protein
VRRKFALGPELCLTTLRAFCAWLSSLEQRVDLRDRLDSTDFIATLLDQ